MSASSPWTARWCGPQGDVAERDRLRGYDAVHLAAAITGQVTVVASAGRHLVEAARRRGLAVAGPP